MKMYRNGIIFLLLFVSNYAGLIKQDAQDVCLTPACVKSAARILGRLDTNVSPCDNFYKFTCGNFIKYTDIPQDMSVYSSFQYLSDLIKKQVKLVLESPIEQDDPKSKSLLKQFFKQCMDTEANERESVKTLEEILKRTGRWPVIEGSNWNASNFDLFNLTVNLDKEDLKSDLMFSISVKHNSKNSSQLDLNFGQPQNTIFTPSLKTIWEKSELQALQRYLINLAKAFGADNKNAEKDMFEAMFIFKEIFLISDSPEERRNISKLANIMTLSEMEGNYTYFPWKKFVNVVAFPGKELDDTYTVMVSDPEHFQKLGKMFNKDEHKRALVNFVYAAVITDVLKYLPDKVRNTYNDFDKEISGQTMREERWKQCAGEASKLSPALGSMYIKNYFNEDIKPNIAKITENIRQEFKKTFLTNDWMDDLTKRNAIDKLDAIKSYIAYPEEILNDDLLNDFYQNLTLDNSYLGSIFKIRRFDGRKQMEQFEKQTSEGLWLPHSLSTETNAIYTRLENSIDIRASILQDIFFDSHRPNYLNYGSIGYIVGHEITHAFDDQGMQFDKHGNLNNWWHPETLKDFLEKAKCIIDQYSNFTVPEVQMHIDGINTQGENIADNGGLKASYNAYMNWVKHNGTEPYLPGLSYTPNQLFWISVGTTWCTIMRSEELRNIIRSDPHAPSEAQVNLPLMNNEFFANDFNCSAGSNMNPVNKCSVW